ncbi:MAG: hypothetical protein KBT87_06600 [Gammaproteobacteria bacterium]|jgi:hypothetical protein|nr:hypothetical protein [Gammaproteobacteria bacterium]MBQ0774321.1 hypothetical protein [Gammaproteobacteria bacterium]|tara:strand:- start:84988 stop:85692 length:705 start_codon:yes stop_codon:yes gene_type:complete
MRHQPTTSAGSNHRSNVIPLFARGEPARPRILRISPECDGIELLYSNDNHPDKLFSLRVLCWAIHDDDEVIAMVPWLGKVVAANALEDPLNGRWEGYRLADGDHLFSTPPRHKFEELQAAVGFFGKPTEQQDNIQEIPDTIGTHAVFSADDFQTVRLIEIVSWRLTGSGELLAMYADEEEVTNTPVLAGDPCLKAAQQQKDFRYFFQHNIANRIKERDPEALAALSLLSEDDEA